MAFLQAIPKREKKPLIQQHRFLLLKKNGMPNNKANNINNYFRRHDEAGLQVGVCCHFKTTKSRLPIVLTERKQIHMQLLGTE